VYVGNLSYDVKYRDLIEFMRGGGWGRFSSWSLLVFLVVGDCGSGSSGGGFSEVRGSEEADSLQQALLCSHAGTQRGRVWIRPMSCGGH